MLSIGRLARHLGVSRTALLYYERIGLLVASGRSGAGYRHYSSADVARAEQLRDYRATGLPLSTIAALLDGKSRPDAIVHRLDEISRDIARLREQQAVLLRLAGAAATRQRSMNRQRWTALLRAAGLDDAAMARWHALFEHQAPRAHADFLRSLGMEAAEVDRIRSWSRKIGV